MGVALQQLLFDVLGWRTELVVLLVQASRWVATRHAKCVRHVGRRSWSTLL